MFNSASRIPIPFKIIHVSVPATFPTLYITIVEVIGSSNQRSELIHLTLLHWRTWWPAIHGDVSCIPLWFCYPSIHGLARWTNMPSVYSTVYVRTLAHKKSPPSSRAENVNRPFTIKWSTRNGLGKGDAYCNNYATLWNIDRGTESRTGGEPCFLHQFQVFLQKLFSTPPTTYSLQRRRTRFQVSRVKMSRREMCKCNDQQNYCTFGKMRFFPPNLLRRILCSESTQLRKHLRCSVM